MDPVAGHGVARQGAPCRSSPTGMGFQELSVMSGYGEDGIPSVLVVDDDETLRMLMAEFLTEASMTVQVAADGKAALAAFQAQRPDVVLLDVMMPGMDGYEVCGRLRGMPGAEHLPILMVTALEDTESIERAYEIGATNFITKPINWPNFPRQIRYALRASRAITELRKSEERYALAARGANDGLWDWDLESDAIHFSPRWKDMLGYGEDAIGTDSEEWFGRIHPKDRPRVERAITAHLLEGASPALAIEHRIRAADDEYRWVLCRGVAIHDDRGKPSRMAGSQTDITARRRAEEQCQHDLLTGLPGRALLMQRTADRIELAQQGRDELFAVLFLDLDDFKAVNDRLGYRWGNNLLRCLGERIQAHLGPKDTVARLGSDEFGILLDAASCVDAASQLINDLQSALGEPFELNGEKVPMTFSAGIALSGAHYQRAEDMVQDADRARYRAKARGRAQSEMCARPTGR